MQRMSRDRLLQSITADSLLAPKIAYSLKPHLFSIAKKLAEKITHGKESKVKIHQAFPTGGKVRRQKMTFFATTFVDRLINSCQSFLILNSKDFDPFWCAWSHSLLS